MLRGFTGCFLRSNTELHGTADLNKSEKIVENAKFHSPSSDTEKEKLRIAVGPPPFVPIRSTEKLVNLFTMQKLR